jgi:hypothetical protein
LDWSAQLSWTDCITAIVGIGGITAAIVMPHRTARARNDRHYHTLYNRRYQELISQAPDDIRAPNFQLPGRQDYAAILRWAHAYCDMCFEQWSLREQGFVSAKLWSFWENGMTIGFARPALQQAWQVIRTDKRCDKDFLLFVERLSAST